MHRFPSLFVSHGAPTLVLDNVAARDFVRGYGAELGRPKAVLAVSAHWETAEPTVGGAARPETIHDFRGFPRELYELRYPAPGAPELAGRVADLLREAGHPAELDLGRGLDHGAWVPLMLMYPEADVPVAQLSIQPDLGPGYHFRVGEALRPLRDEGVLVLASGSATHNLGEFRGRGRDEPAPDRVAAFGEWLAAAIAEGRTDDLLHYRERAPHAERNHPTEEHLLPLFVALGAAGPAGMQGERVHASHTYGVIAMDAYAFA